MQGGSPCPRGSAPPPERCENAAVTQGARMAKPAVWPMIQAERRALAADLEALDEAQWATPSLCGGWTVHDVLAHMTATAKSSPPTFLGRMITSGFSFKKAQSKGIAAEKGTSP